MKVMLFLGSGVSYPSGMPSVGQITNYILHGEWSRHMDGTYFQGKAPSPYLEERDLAVPEQQALRILAEEITEYLNKRNVNRDANYEDLYYVLQQLIHEDTGGARNPVAGPFFERVETLLRPALDDLSVRRRPGLEPYQLYQLCAMCQELIADVVRVNLLTPDSVVGLKLPLQVAADPSVSQLSIVTLNHDRVIEKCLEDAGIGFVEAVCKDSEGHLRSNSRLLESKERVKLVKLHGSIDWQREDPPNRRPILLCGTDNKVASYAFGLFQDLHYFWQRMLDDNDFMVMSGYGWNDSGISARLFQWLSVADNQMVLLAENHEDLLANSGLAMQYDERLAQDRIIPFHNWLKDTSWDQVKSRVELWRNAGTQPMVDAILTKVCQQFADKQLPTDIDALDRAVQALIWQVLKRCRLVEEERINRLNAHERAWSLRRAVYEDVQYKNELVEKLVTEVTQALSSIERHPISPDTAAAAIKEVLQRVLDELCRENPAAHELKRLLAM